MQRENVPAHFFAGRTFLWEGGLSLQFVSSAFSIGYFREMQDSDQVKFSPYRSQKYYVRLHDIWSIASIPPLLIGIDADYNMIATTHHCTK